MVAVGLLLFMPDVLSPIAYRKYLAMENASILHSTAQWACHYNFHTSSGFYLFWPYLSMISAMIVFTAIVTHPWCNQQSLFRKFKLIPQCAIFLLDEKPGCVYLICIYFFIHYLCTCMSIYLFIHVLFSAGLGRTLLFSNELFFQVILPIIFFNDYDVPALFRHVGSASFLNLRFLFSHCVSRISLWCMRSTNTHTHTPVSAT